MYQRLSNWWHATSLRSKITGVTVIVVTVGLMVIGVGTVLSIERYLTTQIDDKIDDAATALPGILNTLDFNDFDRARADGLSNEFFIAAVSATGSVLASNLDEDSFDYGPDVSRLSLAVISEASEPFTLESRNQQTSWRVKTYRLNIVSADSGRTLPATLAIGIDLEESRQVVGSFASVFLAFSLVVVVLSAALTRILVSTTFRPLREVEETAARFAGGDFSQRLGGSTPNTEVGRLTRSLNTMLSRIDRAFADRADTIDQMRRFIGDASHELRTPLVSVRGYAELYRMGAITSKKDVAQAMERIEKEADRMTRLVTDLLELARLDESKPLDLRSLRLIDIAKDQSLDAGAIEPERDISWSLAPGVSEDETTVEADENKLRQVLANLLQNALRFSPEGSPVEVEVDRSHNPERGIIRVIDHGEGIPEQIRKKIFQRFWRADTSRARETGGSGLGLAIASSIISRHAGTISVSETPGGGATFQVALPIVQSPEFPPPIHTDSPPATS
jgi:two-component system OmpR family sensor kinase